MEPRGDEEREGRGGQESADSGDSALVLNLFQISGRNVIVHEDEWGQAGARVLPNEKRGLDRLLRDRDLCILGTLVQLHYLPTDRANQLFWPGSSLRATQQRLRRLREWRLLLRWRRVEPRVGYYKRRSSLHLLSERGAAVLSAYWKIDPKPVIERAGSAANRYRNLDHDLEVIEFLASLAAANRDVPDQGLYHWLGEDTMRRGYERRGGDLAPDGWGRYLTADREVLFNLEWDRGTRSPLQLTEQARGYVQAGEAGEQVLYVAPHRVRERTVRAAVERAGGARGHVRFWTTNLAELNERGPLGELWQGVGGDVDSRRRRLTELPGRPRSERPAAACIGKPGWWRYRPGAGEGA